MRALFWCGDGQTDRWGQAGIFISHDVCRCHHSPENRWKKTWRDKIWYMLGRERKKSFTVSENRYANNKVATTRGGKVRRYDEVSLDTQLGDCDSRSADPLHGLFSWLGQVFNPCLLPDHCSMVLLCCPGYCFCSLLFCCFLHWSSIPPPPQHPPVGSVPSIPPGVGGGWSDIYCYV